MRVRLAAVRAVPKSGDREMERPKKGEVRTPTGGPGLVWLKRFCTSSVKFSDQGRSGLGAGLLLALAGLGWAEGPELDWVVEGASGAAVAAALGRGPMWKLLLA